MSTAGSATPGDIFAALLAAHQAGDYWVQTQAQAARKGLPGWPGRLACARHVTAMTACKAAALAALHASGRRVSPRRAAAALAADAASHYLADRRTPLASLAEWLGATVSPGKDQFWALGTPREGRDDNPCLGTGAQALDQAFHVACLWVAALMAYRPSPGEEA